MLDLPASIDTKADMYALLNRGVLGNTARVFASLEEAEKYHAPVNIRSRQGSGKGFKYGVAPADLRAASQEFIRSGITELQYNEAMPDDLLLLQGEISRDIFHLYLRYDDTPGRNMREAMANCKHVSGLAADMLLKSRMTPSDYDDVCDLLDIWPDAVIEFSTYSEGVGQARCRNTVVWEVRCTY